MNPQAIIALLNRKGLTTFGSGIICLYVGAEYHEEVLAALSSPLVAVLAGAGAWGSSAVLSYKNTKKCKEPKP
jgi:hypothetical protein